MLEQNNGIKADPFCCKQTIAISSMLWWTQPTPKPLNGWKTDCILLKIILWAFVREE